MHLFACPTHNQAEFLRLPLPYKAMVNFLRFRAGCHALPNVTRGREGVPRSQRLCPLCQSQYCDERHALRECPALVSLREKYHQLYCVHNSSSSSSTSSSSFHAAVFMAE